MCTEIIPTPDQINAYVEKQGMRCPACGSPMVNTESVPDDSESHELVQDVNCLSCGASWQDVYTLTTIRNLKIYAMAEAQ